MNESVDVIVLGGGISGLAAAHSALHAGASVLVIEAGSRTGGVMHTETIDGFLVEHGPTSMSGSDQAFQLMQTLGLTPDVVTPAPAAKRRYIVRNSVMHALPTSPAALFHSTLLSARAKLRMIAEPFIGRTAAGLDESLGSFVQRRFGRDVLNYVVDPFVSGVCAGDASRLSKRFTLRTLDELERAHGSVLLGAIKRARGGPAKQSSHIVSFRNGMQQLPNALVQAITTTDNCEIHLNTRAITVSRSPVGWSVHTRTNLRNETFNASTIVSALPAHALAAVSWPDQLADSFVQLTGVRHAPIATVALGFHQSQVAHPLDGFGALFPSLENRRILGVLFNSSLFGGRTPNGYCLLTVFVGGARADSAPAEADAIEAAVDELTPLLGITGPPVMTRVARWEQGIPQLEVGHEKTVATALAIEECEPEVFMTGSYLSGVAIGDCLTHGAAAGARAAGRALRVRPDACKLLARAGG